MGWGNLTRVAGAGNLAPMEAAKAYNQVQKSAGRDSPGDSAINHEECCAGLMAKESTVYPQLIGLASSFSARACPGNDRTNPQADACDGRATGAGTGIDVCRDPRWGRIEETFGEDPLLVSQFGMEYIRGITRGGSETGILATGKHFVGHAFFTGRAELWSGPPG